MEHLATFGLDRDPFGCDSQMLWYFEGAAFADATKRLHRAALQAKSLCLVSGRSGVGKTMLVRHLQSALEDEVFEVSMLVAVPGITDMRWLLTRWAHQLGVECPSAEPATALAQVYEKLAIVREDGRNAVLIVDEAQVIAERGFLADLRGLLNLEYEEKRLITLVLVGSPKLAEAVASEPALSDRVDVRLSIPPLHSKEVVGYLRHRIRAAGGNPAIFESSAVKAVTRLCGGVPRRINALADNALFEAHCAGRVSATEADVLRAAAALGDPHAEDPAGAEGASLARSGIAEGSRAERASMQPPTSLRRREGTPPGESLFAEEAALELGDVVAEPSDRHAPATVLMHDLEPVTESHVELDYSVAAPDGPEFRVDDTGELEDLFADIVDE